MKKKERILLQNQAQSAMEYMLLLSAVAIIVVVGFKSYFPNLQQASNEAHTSFVNAMMGTPPKCGDGVCNYDIGERHWRCRVDCPNPDPAGVYN